MFTGLNDDVFVYLSLEHLCLGVYTEVMRGGVEAYDTMRSEGETAETASVKTDPKS